MARNLHDTQQLFWQLITAAQGADRGLTDLGLSVEDLEEVVRSDERLNAVERMDVYANMYFFRILDVVKDDYPRLAKLVGDTRFHNLITDYLLTHPSSHPSLRFIGRQLPEFVRTHALGERHPEAADLAALEWARADVFDDRDHEVLTAQALGQIPPEQWADLYLEPIPALRLLDLDWPVHQAWRALKVDEDPSIEPGRTLLRVWRRDVNVIVHEPMSELENAALRGFADGKTLGPLCEELAGGGDPDEVTAEIAALLGGWLEDQLIAAAGIRR